MGWYRMMFLECGKIVITLGRCVFLFACLLACLSCYRLMKMKSCFFTTRQPLYISSHSPPIICKFAITHLVESTNVHTPLHNLCQSKPQHTHTRKKSLISSHQRPAEHHDTQPIRPQMRKHTPGCRTPNTDAARRNTVAGRTGGNSTSL